MHMINSTVHVTTYTYLFAFIMCINIDREFEDDKMAATIARIIVLAFCLVLCQVRVFAFEDDAGMKREVHEDADNIHPKGGIGTTGTSREDGQGERDGADEGDDILPVQTPHTWIYSIDVDEDGTASLEEIVEWIMRNEDKGISSEINLQWSMYDTNKNSKVEWPEYQLVILRKYGVRDEDMKDQELIDSLTATEKDKFLHADRDNNSFLDVNELKALLYPHHHDHMIEHMVDQMLSVWDKDSNGEVTLEEYKAVYVEMFSDMGTGDEANVDISNTLKEEVEKFQNVYDKNKDGKLNREEIGPIVAPHRREKAQEEAKRMFDHADANKDGKVSHEEMMESMDMFLSESFQEGDTFGTHDEL